MENMMWLIESLYLLLRRCFFFTLPITRPGSGGPIMGLILICHSSYRGVVELLRDLFDLPMSVGTIHNRLQSAADKASAINLTQDLGMVQTQVTL